MSIIICYLDVAAHKLLRGALLLRRESVPLGPGHWLIQGSAGDVIDVVIVCVQRTLAAPLYPRAV
jgi:hypothetical protein